MGDQFWGVDFEQEIADAMTPADLPHFTLSVPSGTTPLANLVDGDDQEGGPTDYDCHGAITRFTDTEISDSPNIIRGDVKVVLIAKPLNDVGIRPKKDDKLTQLSTGRVMVIVDTLGDGAGAAFMLHCR